MEQERRHPEQVDGREPTAPAIVAGTGNPRARHDPAAPWDGRPSALRRKHPRVRRAHGARSAPHSRGGPPDRPRTRTAADGGHHPPDRSDRSDRPRRDRPCGTRAAAPAPTAPTAPSPPDTPSTCPAPGPPTPPRTGTTASRPPTTPTGSYPRPHPVPTTPRRSPTP
ncbi:hypothetical protein GCM10010349_41420 [Streptomyces flavofungini]|nr:hypothetical protein GCM10010349_41420 [Streptomyces flavofungini]